MVVVVVGGGGVFRLKDYPCERRHRQSSHSAVGWILTTKEGERERAGERVRE